MLNSRRDTLPEHGLTGAGLGLRRALLPSLLRQHPAEVGFLELAPENWVGVGGRYARQLEELARDYPLSLHGLSLSLGGPEPLDECLLYAVRELMENFGISLYSEHLSYCTDGAHLYDLLPIPFTEQAIEHLVQRIDQAQTVLKRRIAIENVSYYAVLPPTDMTELAFLTEVLERADCELLLDVNNVYVNSVNHSYNAKAFLAALPSERIACIHIAGHYREAPDLIVDTHGADVIADVWGLLERCYALHGVRPTLLERDFNFPPLDNLCGELGQISALQQRALQFMNTPPERRLLSA